MEIQVPADGSSWKTGPTFNVHVYEPEVMIDYDPVCVYATKLLGAIGNIGREMKVAEYACTPHGDTPVDLEFLA